MKGIILAGGKGSRLYPLTEVVSKQLQAVYDKPMVYYPLCTLINNGVNDICLISSPEDLPKYEKLLKSGSQFGINIEYREQILPNGIGEAFIIAENFIKQDNICLILGDNIFYGDDWIKIATKGFDSGALIFGYEVDNPEEFGVVEVDENGFALTLEEKPKDPKSNYAVPGVYIYDNQVVEISKNIVPSKRGELEITDINKLYLKEKQLQVKLINEGMIWMDSGTSRSLLDTSNFINLMEKKDEKKVGCIEETAWKNNLINNYELIELTKSMPECEYKVYLENLVILSHCHKVDSENSIIV